MTISKINIFTDFHFPSSCSQIKISNDQSQVIATGEYPPQFKIFLFEDCCEYLERRLDAQIVDFCFVGKNSRKLAFLRNDKIVEFFHKHQSYYKLKLPDFGRSIERVSSDLYISTQNHVLQSDLEKGILDSIYKSEELIYQVKTSAFHGIQAICHSSGVYFLDTHNKECIKDLKFDRPVKCVEFDENMGLACATDSEFNILDLRCDQPSLKSEQKEINQIKRHDNLWYFTNKDGLKAADGVKTIESIEIDKISSLTFKDSIIFIGLENGKVETYHTGKSFLPEWCSQAERYVSED